ERQRVRRPAHRARQELGAVDGGPGRIVAVLERRVVRARLLEGYETLDGELRCAVLLDAALERGPGTRRDVGPLRLQARQPHGLDQWHSEQLPERNFDRQKSPSLEQRLSQSPPHHPATAGLCV